MPSSFPSDEQKKVIELPGSALVVAGPGTGKTRTAIAKARCSITRLTNPATQRVLFLSFSNSAVLRLLESAKTNLTTTEKRLLRFQTYHSFAFETLRNYGRFVGLGSQITVADTLERTMVALEKGWNLDDAKIEHNFSTLAKKQGLLTFDHIIPFALKLLTQSPSIRLLLGRRFPFIIVDEFQDTSQNQWNLLQLIGENAEVTAFGDPNQIIYESTHKATAQRFEQFKRWKDIVATPFTPKNFRCGSAEILDFTECILKGKPFPTSKNGDVATFRLNFRTELRARLALIWRAIRDQVGKNETVGFLTPSNKLAEEVSVSLRNPPIGTQVHFPVYAPIVPDDSANDAIRLCYDACREDLLSPTPRTQRNLVLTLAALKPMWRGGKVGAKDLTEIAKVVDKQLKTPDSLLSRLRTKLKSGSSQDLISEFVEAIISLPKFEKVGKRIKDHGLYYVKKASIGQLSLFDESRANRKPKGLYGTSNGGGLTQVLNYHKSKGREFDFVVIVADPRQESKYSPLDERRRLYYVSATRARKWLGIVYFNDQDGIGDVLKPVIAAP